MADFLKNENFAKSQVNVGINAAVLSVVLDDGGDFADSGIFVGVFWDGSSAAPSLDSQREIVLATKTAANTFTITRAQEGTLANSWSAGSNFASVISAGKVDELQDAIQSGSKSFARSSGTNTYNVALTPAADDYEDGMLIRTVFVNASTDVCSLNLNALGSKKLYGVVDGTFQRLGSGDIRANFYASVVYDATLDSSAGGWVVLNAEFYSFPYTEDTDTDVSGKSWVLTASDSIAPDDTKLPTWAMVTNKLIPPGMISMWSGAVLDLPINWVLCDGSNNTPDLSGVFIKGAITDVTMNLTGGDTATIANDSHTHTLPSTDGHQLTVAEIPSHGHKYDTLDSNVRIDVGLDDICPTVSTSTEIQTSVTGGDGSHSHGISGASGSDVHNHGISNIQPAFYTLAYIMYKPV